MSLDDPTLELLEKNDLDFSENSDATLKYLKDNGFLVASDFDELSFLKYYNNKVRFAEDYLSLTIAPTLSCNFDFPYCFENKRGGIIDEETQELVIDFLHSKLSKGVRKMDLTWYGGEPLICFPIIKNMCEQITALTQKY